MSTKAARRHLRRVSEYGDIVEFRIKSATRNDGTKYHPHVDKTTGAWWCDCLGFQYRQNCRHVKQAIANLTRHGEITLDHIGGCVRCGDHNADHYYGVCDEQGNALHGVAICNKCVQKGE